MLAQVLTAYFHVLGIMSLMAALLAEYVTLQPNMTRLHVQRLALTDLIYGVTAGVVLLTGLSRLLVFGKGASLYLGSPVFYLKVGLELALLLVIPLLAVLMARGIGLGRSAGQATQDLQRGTALVERIEV